MVGTVVDISERQVRRNAGARLRRLRPVPSLWACFDEYRPAASVREIAELLIPVHGGFTNLSARYCFCIPSERVLYLIRHRFRSRDWTFNFG